MIRILAAITFVCVFYSMGQFGVTSIFGVRREAQMVALIALGGLALARLGRLRLSLWNPVVWLLLPGVFISMREKETLIQLTAYFVSALAAATFESFEPRGRRTIVKGMVIGSSIFAFLSLVQIIYLLSDYTAQGLMTGMNTKEAHATEMEQIAIVHPAMYLGFFNTFHDFRIFGVYVPRVFSFANEPSVLSYSIFAPGLLGFLLGGPWRWLGLVTIVFCLGPAQSGNLWLGVFGGLGVYLVSVITRWISGSRRTPATFIAVMAIALVLINVGTANMTDFTAWIGAEGQKISGVSTEMGNKEQSAYARLESMQEGLKLVLEHPLGGAPDFKAVSSPFAVTYGLALGVVGLLIASVSILAIVERLAKHAERSKNQPLSPAAKLVDAAAIYVLCGACLVALLFQGYGWDSSSGLIMLYMIATFPEWAETPKARVAGLARRAPLIPAATSAA